MLQSLERRIAQTQVFHVLRGEPELHCLEVFAGAGNICKAVREAGLQAEAYDLRRGADENVLTASGYFKALWLSRMQLWLSWCMEVCVVAVACCTHPCAWPSC